MGDIIVPIKEDLYKTDPLTVVTVNPERVSEFIRSNDFDSRKDPFVDPLIDYLVHRNIRPNHDIARALRRMYNKGRSLDEIRSVDWAPEYDSDYNDQVRKLHKETGFPIKVLKDRGNSAVLFNYSSPGSTRISDKKAIASYLGTFGTHEVNPRIETKNHYAGCWESDKKGGAAPNKTVSWLNHVPVIGWFKSLFDGDLKIGPSLPGKVYGHPFDISYPYVHLGYHFNPKKYAWTTDKFKTVNTKELTPKDITRLDLINYDIAKRLPIVFYNPVAKKQGGILNYLNYIK